MFKVPLLELKERILKSSRITSPELEHRIKAKINELSGLISEEGAAHILANELGIDLMPQQGKLKIKEIYAGMRSVSTVGKVVRKFEVREFVKGDKKGKVCSVVLGDETGTIRLVFWNDHVLLTEKIQENDILLVKEGYARENNGMREVHLGDRASIVINPEGESVQSVRQTAVNAGRKSINQLSPGEEGVEILGTVVQVFDPRFFTVCSQCNKRATEENGGFRCGEHGIVQPSYGYVLNLVLDDGTGTIRSIFWKNQVNHLLGKEEGTMLVYKENGSSFEDVKTDLLGEQLKLLGRVQKNDMFDRIEFNVQIVEKANPEEELARLEKSQ